MLGLVMVAMIGEGNDNGDMLDTSRVSGGEPVGNQVLHSQCIQTKMPEVGTSFSGARSKKNHAEQVKKFGNSEKTSGIVQSREISYCDNRDLCSIRVSCCEVEGACEIIRPTRPATIGEAIEVP